MTAYAQAERRALCALFDQIGPEGPTLCEGWRTADLAAHLVLRERRPDAAPGILVPWLRAYTERVQRAVRDGRAWPDLVDAVRSGPPALLRPLDEPVNTVEYFVHHEDVRRAGADVEPRELDPGLDKVLWARTRALARLARRKSPVALALEAPGFGRVQVRPGSSPVVLTGAPGELLLFLVGRQEAARVQAAGDDDAVARVRQAPFGL